MRRAAAAAVIAATMLVAPLTAAHAEDGPGGPGWPMAACDYQESWIPQCGTPWIYPKAHPVRTYRVHRGDTLWRIAVRSYGPAEHAGHQWHRIAAANHLRGTLIHPGQVLRIP